MYQLESVQLHDKASSSCVLEADRNDLDLAPVHDEVRGQLDDVDWLKLVFLDGFEMCLVDSGILVG